MITIQEAQALIKQQENNDMKRLNKLKDYYDGRHKILEKGVRADRTVPTKIVNNYSKVITKQCTGYFIGNPITYSGENLEDVMDLFKLNYETSHNAELATIASIYGKAFELNYIDEEGMYNFVAVDPRDIIVTYSNSIKPVITGAVTIATSKTIDDEYLVRISIYDETSIATYEAILENLFDISNEGIAYKAVENIPHHMGAVPIIEYKNNIDATGDFEGVIELIDAYNEAISSSVDDLKDFTDAFLCLINMGNIEEEEVRKLKESKVLAFDENGRAEWLIKQVNDTYSTNIKNRITQDIHKFSFTVDLTDKAFGGNISGIAIEFKFQSLEQLRQEKEHNFNKALVNRFKLLSLYFAKHNKTLEVADIDIQFQINLPVNVTEKLNSLKGSVGFISHKTLLAQVPFIQDVDKEIEMLAEEKEAEKPVDNLEEVPAVDVPVEATEEGQKEVTEFGTTI